MVNIVDVFNSETRCFCDPTKSNLYDPITKNLVVGALRAPRKEAACGLRPQPQEKLLSLKQPPNYLGISSKMAYGLHSRTTPGLSNKFNKKVMDKAVSRTPIYQENASCGNIIGSKLVKRQQPCKLLNIHPSVQRKQTCFSQRFCNQVPPNVAAGSFANYRGERSYNNRFRVVL